MTENFVHDMLSSRGRDKVRKAMGINMKNWRSFLYLIVAPLFLINCTMTCAYADAFGDGYDAYNRQDYQTALAIWQQLAEQGHVEAQHVLGTMYRGGYGVPVDDKLAVKWLRKAAIQGNHNAQIKLSYMYQEGRGVPQDHKLKFKWALKSAEGGYEGAQYAVGRIYESGRGVAMDKKKALKWYRKCAAQGKEYSQRALEAIERLK